MDYFCRVSITLTFLFSSFSVFAQNEDIGFQQLLIPSDAFYLSSGQSSAALVNTSSSIFISSYIHPSFRDINDVTVSRYSYLAGMDMNSLTSRLTLFGQPIQFGWQKITAHDIEIRDRPGTIQTTTEVYWMTTAIGTAFHWLDSDWGITYKYAFQKLYLAENDAHLFDFSFSNQAMRDAGLHFITIQNMGVATSLDRQKVNLPILIKVGWIFYNLNLTNDMNLKWLNESSFMFYGKQFQTNNSLYLTTMNLFILQAGYRIGHDTNPFSGGLSVVYQPFIVNYAFNYFKNGLNSTHAFTVSWLF